jgi:hypothetical protein
MHEKGDFDTWLVSILKRPPIDLQSISDSDLEDELEERIGALLSFYGCEATAEGWRGLALKLALKHEPMLKIITPADRVPGAGGREPEETFRYLFMLNNARKKYKSNAETAKGIHRELKKTRGKNGTVPSVRRLQNILSEAAAGRVPHPRWMQRLAFEQRIDAVMTKAIEALEAAQEAWERRVSR